jgi:transposase
MHSTSGIAHKSRVLEMVDQNRISLREATLLINLSYRHLRRLYKRYQEEGSRGLIHGLRGRRSNRGFDPKKRKRILEYYLDNLPGWGPTLAAQKLASLGYAVSRETLRRWLIQEGIWYNKTGNHKEDYKRKIFFGEKIWLYHHPGTWLGKNHKPVDMVNLIDDASGITFSRICETENGETECAVLRKWVERYGIPMTICCRIKKEYSEQTKNSGSLSEVCRKLGVEITAAPWFKIRRHLPDSYCVYYRELYKRIRRERIHTIPEANNLIVSMLHENVNVPLSNNMHVGLRQENDLDVIFNSQPGGVNSAYPEPRVSPVRS